LRQPHAHLRSPLIPPAALQHLPLELRLCPLDLQPDPPADRLHNQPAGQVQDDGDQGQAHDQHVDQRIFGNEEFPQEGKDHRAEDGPFQPRGPAENRHQDRQEGEQQMVHIGDQTVNDEPQVPFGGVKGSGYGRFGGQAALDEFTELRWINVQRTPRTFP